MKLRGLASPDCGDVFAMSYAVKLAPRTPITIVTEWLSYSSGESSNHWMA